MTELHTFFSLNLSGQTVRLLPIVAADVMHVALPVFLRDIRYHRRTEHESLEALVPQIVSALRIGREL